MQKRKIKLESKKMISIMKSEKNARKHHLKMYECSKERTQRWIRGAHEMRKNETNKELNDIRQYF